MVSTRDVIVVGASAGGVEALCAFAAGLPERLAASVLVVLHLPTGYRSVLPGILQRAGPLCARTARNGSPLRHGVIQAAPPGHHLLVEGGVLALSSEPPVRGRRPAIDMLFRSAARAAGPRVTGVLLSGVLDDGVAGLSCIAGRGGTVVVQDPAEARYPAMPELARHAVDVDHVLKAGDMGAVLDRISREEIDVDDEPPGRPAPALEQALGVAVRTLDDKAALVARMADRARDRGNVGIASRYDRLARETAHAADVLRRRSADAREDRA
jgi:two-component system chemotaxis response regulator CheB